MTEPKPFTAAQFSHMNAFTKGYAVYMLGARDDEPHVPESYTPTERERKEYESGQAAAVRDTQDCP